MPGHSRRLVTVACCLPPVYAILHGRAALAHIEDVVLEVKQRFRDPFIIVAGDFNQWAVLEALEDFPDLKEAPVGVTRKDKCIDRMFTSFGRSIKEAGTLPPLESREGRARCPSDHRIAYLRVELHTLEMGVRAHI